MKLKSKKVLMIIVLGLVVIVVVSFIAIVNIQPGFLPFLAHGDNSAGTPGLNAPQWQPTASDAKSDNNTLPAGTTATAIAMTRAGSPLVQLALSQSALTSLLASQLGAQQNTLTDLKIIPTPNDGLTLTLNLQIATGSIHRVMPIELDSTIELSSQQNVMFNVLHFKRDGLDAGPIATENMQTAINQLLASLLMPNIHSQLKGMKLISVNTSPSMCCGVNSEMLVLLLQLN